MDEEFRHDSIVWPGENRLRLIAGNMLMACLCCALGVAAWMMARWLLKQRGADEIDLVLAFFAISLTAVCVPGTLFMMLSAALSRKCRVVLDRSNSQLIVRNWWIHRRRLGLPRFVREMRFPLDDVIRSHDAYGKGNVSVRILTKQGVIYVDGEKGLAIHFALIKHLEHRRLH